ncbi:MAG: glycoside hydrolase family 13 protein [Clostridia bacterium]|nr:glycoside hydrolase family 13 protein [Clostridia bacterium]
MLIHNSHQKYFRTPAGPAPAGSKVTVRLLCDEAEAVSLRTWDGAEALHPMTFDGRQLWQATITLPDTPGLFWYDFVITARDGRIVRYGNAYDKLGGEGAVYEIGQVNSFQITVYSPSFKTPSFMHGASIYQIFPDRFRRAPTESVDDRTDRVLHASWDEPLTTPATGDYMATDFYGGTLTGVMEKLPYLHSLGITVIYLNPIFRARSNHRYDTGDYMQIDPLLGTEAEFAALCGAAEKLGIRVMLDGVFSHTGDDSRYFNRYGRYPEPGAYQGGSPYDDWYTFREDRDSYECWWGFPTLPAVRKEHPAYRDFMFRDKTGVVPRWIHAGAAGWRLDVADELPMDFLRELRKSAKRARRDAVVLGEVWEDASNKVSYGELRCYCTGDTLDSVMNYPLREAIIAFATGRTSARELVRLIRRQQEVYPPQFLYSLMNLIGSHDRARVLNVLCGKEGRELPRRLQRNLHLSEEEYALAVERLRTCVDILCALPGCPTIYYGDEAGMTGCPDPFCRRPFPWGQEDASIQQLAAERLNERKHSPLLKYGYCDVSAPDDDTLRIHRYFTETDALGRKVRKPDRRVITVRR